MPGDPVAAALSRLERSLAQAMKPLASLRGAVRAARRRPSSAAIARLESAMRAIDAAPPGLMRDLQAALHALHWSVAAANQQRLLAFTRELQTAARRMRLVPRLVATHPEQWRLGPLTLHVDRTSETAELRYARAPVATRLSCRANAILRAWESSCDRLKKKSLAPDRLWAVLAPAYQSLLGSRPTGERVALVDLFARVRRRVRGYSRAQFSFDLARLKWERRLVHAGHRIDLSIATSTSASDEERVLWIEEAAGGGQYYLYFRMLPQRETHDERADLAPGAKNSQPDGRERKAAGAGRVPRQRRQRNLSAVARKGLRRGPDRTR